MKAPLYDDQQQDLAKSDKDFFNAHPDLQSLGDKSKTNDLEDFDKWGDEQRQEKELDQEQLGSAELGESSPVAESTAEKTEAQEVNASTGDYYNAKGGDGNWLRKIRTRKSILKIGLLLAFPILGLTAMTILSGPLKLVHISKMFQRFHFSSNESSQNSRVGRIIEYVRTSGPNGDKSRRNVGIIAEKLSSKHQNDLSRKGITIGYDRPLNPDGSSNGTSRRMQSLEIDTSTPEGKRTAEALKAEGFNVPDRPDGLDGPTTVNFRDVDGGGTSGAKIRRRALDITVDAQGKKGISSAISKRLLRARAGVDFSPLKNNARDAGENFADYKARKQRERAERHRNGSTSLTDGRRLDGTTSTNEAGETVPNQGTSEAAQGGNRLAADIADADTPTARSGMLGRLLPGGAAVVGVLCMVRDVGDDIPNYQHANVVLPLVRVGMEFVSIGSQIQGFLLGIGPPPDLDEMRAVFEVVDDKETKSYFLNARSIEEQNGNPGGGVPLDRDVDVSGVGEKPMFFNAVDNIPVLGTACGAITGVTNALKSIPFLGAGITAVEDFQAQAINAVLAVGGTSVEELMESVISFFSGGAVDTANAIGAPLGGLADFGVFLAEKEQAVAIGGTELLPEQLNAIKNEAFQDFQYAQSQKNIFARIFSPVDSDSLLAQAFIQNPEMSSFSKPLDNMAFLSTSFFSRLGNVEGIFTKKAKAAPVPYDFGVPASGFGLDILENDAYGDPSANADLIEPRLAELNEYYRGCFGTIIDPTTFAMTFQESLNYGDRDGIAREECRMGGETLERYRLYLLDTVTLRSMACYEGLDELSCDELGIGDGNSTTATNNTPTSGASTISAPGLNGYAIPCTGLPATPETRGARGDNINWTGIPDSGTIGTTSGGQPIKVYIREACTQTDVKTVVIGSSIHATENYGQPISFELLFKKTLPANMRVIAIPEINGSGLIPPAVGRINANGVNLNRNYDYRWNDMSGDELVRNSENNYRGLSPASEPETQAMVSFLTSLGDTVSVLLAYHDDLDYLGGAHNTDPAIATSYLATLREGGIIMAHGNDSGRNIRQRGSLDGWYNQALSRPALLIEMPPSSSATQLGTHADAVIGLVTDGVI